LGKASGKDGLDLTLALAGHSLEKLFVIFDGQPWTEKLERREIHAIRSEKRAKRRESAD
jgi:hypothetical protein